VKDESHISVEDALDVVRGAASPDTRRAVEQHLAEGCPACRTLVDSWRAVAAVMGREARYEPKPHVIRMARAALPVRKPRGVFEGIAETAKLVFDSRFAALPAGVRQASPGLTGGRKLLYETADLIFDVQVQPATADSKTVVIGQVVRPLWTKDGGIEDAPVVVSSRTREIASTTTNRFGEFMLEFDNAAVLSLTVDVDGDAIMIPIDAQKAAARGASAKRTRAKKTH
jgi:hypothetical protein